MNLSTRVYGLLLLAYPPEFRREFGGQMLQVFRDSYRAEALNGSVPSFWLRTLLDLVSTAAKERIESSGREGVSMNKRSDAVALLGCAGIIVIAFLLQYVTRNSAASFILINYVLDPLVVTGVIGNFIVFLLSKTTKLNPLRMAITVFAVVHAACLLLIVVLSSSGPPVNWAGVLIGYVLSFVIWVGLHFAWRTTNRNQALNSQH
jgi:Flp pilus assembly protein TadB